jgi:hypothetical protein
MTMAKNRNDVATPCDQGLFSLFVRSDEHRERTNRMVPSMASFAAHQQIDARIIATRACTPAGISRKVLAVLDVMNTQEDEPDCWYRRMLRSVLADLVATEDRQH